MIKNLPKSISFESLFNICRIALRFSGILAIDNIFCKSSRIRNLKFFYYVIGILPVIFVFICETRSIIHFWKLNVFVALEICTAVLSGVVVITQGFYIYYSRNRLLKLIVEIKELWDGQHEVPHDVVKKVKGAQMFTKYYAILVMMLASSFTLRPFCLLINHLMLNKNETYDFSQTAYPTIYPFAIDTLAKYLTCISFEFLVFISVGAWWIATDTLFLQLATHLRVQFEVLNANLMDDLIESDPILRLTLIGRNHSRLLRLSEEFKQIFSPILFCLMAVTSANSCICIVSLQNELTNKNIAGVSKRIVHTLVTMIQPAIYCKHGNDLCEWAEFTANAAFESNWTDRSQSFKKYLRLVGLRAQQGLKFRIYGFFDVNLHQLSQIGGSAVSFFALLRTVS